MVRPGEQKREHCIVGYIMQAGEGILTHGMYSQDVHERQGKRREGKGRRRSESERVLAQSLV